MRFMVDLDIHGYTITCLNCASRVVLAANSNTSNFITGWVVPLLRNILSNSILQTRTSVGIATDDPDKPVFRLLASPYPAIRGKVTWNVQGHRWMVNAKKIESSKCLLEFCVDQSLPLAHFEKVKMQQYLAAIASWNNNDKSKKLRITSVGIASP